MYFLSIWCPLVYIFLQISPCNVVAIPHNQLSSSPTSSKPPLSLSLKNKPSVQMQQGTGRCLATSCKANCLYLSFPLSPPRPKISSSLSSLHTESLSQPLLTSLTYPEPLFLSFRFTLSLCQRYTDKVFIHPSSSLFFYHLHSSSG